MGRALVVVMIVFGYLLGLGHALMGDWAQGTFWLVLAYGSALMAREDR